MAKSKLVQANEKIARGVTGGFRKVQDAVVGGYTKIEDRFVERYLTHEGESAVDAKKRLKQEEQGRKSKDESVGG